MSTSLIIILTILILYIITYVIETINLHKFNIKIFNYGLTIFQKELKIKFSNWKNLYEIEERKEGKYVFIENYKTGYFVTKFRFFRQYSLFARSSSLFPLNIFGNFSENENTIKIEFKISYRIVVFVVLWLLPWIILPFLSMDLLSFGVGIGGIVFTALILYFARIFLEGRMLMMTDEITEILKVKK